MKKKNLVSICLGAMMAIVIIVLLLILSQRTRSPDTGNPFERNEAEVASILDAINTLDSPKKIQKRYALQQDLLKDIAEFIFQYPLRDNENMAIYNFDEIKISVFSLNRPSKNIANEVDEDFMSKIEQLYAKGDFSSIDSNIGNDFVMFTATKTGFNKCNGIIITKGEIHSKEEFGNKGIESSILSEEISLLEPIEEDVYYFEVK